MSDINFLNLDELAPVTRKVTLKGKTYQIKDMTVEHFVELNKFLVEVAEKGESTPEESIAITATTVAMSLEGCDVETIRSLTLPQLNVLSQFIRGEFVPAGAAQVAPGFAGGNEGKEQA